jgi:hypothetical protein
VLVRSASARYCVPVSPIRFNPRFSVVSTWVKSEDEYERDEKRMRITVLVRNIAARCCVPTAPI